MTGCAPGTFQTGSPAQGGLTGLAAYLRRTWKCRYFWLSMARLDLRMRYHGSFLGILWSLVNPLAMTAVAVPLGVAGPSRSFQPPSALATLSEIRVEARPKG